MARRLQKGKKGAEKASPDAVKVAVRVRPLNQRELSSNALCVVTMDGNSTTIVDPRGSKQARTFTFDHSFWSFDGFKEDASGYHAAANEKYTDQRRMFQELGMPLVDNAFEGYNAALFAYGQTGAGKSYSMVGYGANPGIIPMTCEEIFRRMAANSDQNMKYQVSFSMLEIYNERVRDLLAPPARREKPNNLNVRQHPKLGFYVEGLSKIAVSTYPEIERLMEAGNRTRITASTTMNETSSRSHMVITLKFHQVFPNAAGKSTTKASDIHLVDLAGSERADSSKATGDRLREGSMINQSLSTLGNVIKALADQAAGKKEDPPYRNSVLTKLLKNALGGNSRTVMLAAVSPAAINYGETLSTLRYADRAKRIQNNAVINESPTDKMIRELKEENARLLAALKKGGLTPEMKAAMLANEHELESELAEMQASWEQRLQEARSEWEKQAMSGTQRVGPMAEPHLRNVNEDPQLSGLVRHAIAEGTSTVGRASNGADVGDGPTIALGGISIAAEHAIITRSGDAVSLRPAGAAQVLHNGERVTGKVALRHGDRVVFATSHMYVFVGTPAQREQGAGGDGVGYEEVAQEAAAAHGLGGLIGGADAAATDLIKTDLMTLLPMVAEANAMSQEMGKGIKFELQIKSNTSHDLNNRAREVCIKVTDVAKMFVWLWSKPKFVNRKYDCIPRYLMQEVYQAWSEGHPLDVDEEKDPFWDPPEDFFLGSVFVILQPLAYCIDINETMSVTNYQGGDEGVLEVALDPCMPDGAPPTEDMFVSSPEELLGKRLDFRVRIVQARGVKWVQEDKTRGVLCRYKFYTDPKSRSTKSVKHTMNPDFNYSKQFTIRSVSEAFLAYLEKSALVVEMWGRQGKGAGAGFNRGTTMISSSGPSFRSVSTLGSRSTSAATLHDRDLDMAQKEGEWIREKRVLEGTIRDLQEEVQLMGIEMGALESQATAGADGVSAPDGAVASPRAAEQLDPKDPTSALRTSVDLFLGNHAMQRIHVEELALGANPLTDEDRANLESFCDQQAAEVQRITRMLEESVEGLRTAVKGLGKKR